MIASSSDDPPAMTIPCRECGHSFTLSRQAVDFRQQYTRLTGLSLLVCLDMPNTKPYVAVACFCENVLEEKDDVLTAVRIVDTYVLPPLPKGVEVPPEALQGIILLKGLISLKSGDVLGPGTLQLIMHRTTGERIALSPDGGWPVEFKGGEHGVNLKLLIPLGVKNFGLIWFDVLWGEEVLTRIPLRLKRGEMPDETPAPS